MYRSLAILALLSASSSITQGQEAYSGIYPHLAFFNQEDECGTGAVVPWAGSLWAITYAPHRPEGSTDKLYEITPDLVQIVHPESIGGTPANRMIHRESNQLFIGPYAIDAQKKVRAIPYSTMFGRHTANARHLTDPENKIYYITMEEALYEVDVHSLEVKTIYHDEQVDGEPKANLPGYHGKGTYTGQGRLVYANNGEKSREAHTNPFIPSGVLAEWDGNEWNTVLRNQFTEVTGPGGIYGNEHPETDPIWSMGWDARSLIFMLLDNGNWHRYRLPKASHSYDGSHGWNTEWPRIRDIGEDDLLMTMHGMFWKFPKTFSAKNSKGITPRSTYLKVIGDFARWQDQIVLGCDDTARNEFLNTRKAKGHIAAPQSQSNLWFIAPEKLDNIGPIIGRGAVWMNDSVKANQPSDPFLIAGFDKRAIHLTTEKKTTITLEMDVKGDGNWKKLTEVDVDGYYWYPIDSSLDATWIRICSSKALEKATAWFHLAGNDDRKIVATPEKFNGVARSEDKNVTGGLIRAQSDDQRTLQFAATDSSGKIGYYILDEKVNLVANAHDDKWDWMQENADIPSYQGVLEVDAASVLYIDDNGLRYRLPRNPDFDEAGPVGFGRLSREVATERDLFNCHGTFYELPAKNAAGFPRLRPVTTHNLKISDYCSYRGLFVISGINMDGIENNRHIITSDDGKTALWVGAIDDIWELGKPVGNGGPWLNTPITHDQASDPYLITGYDKKALILNATTDTVITAEIDLTGMGDWHPYKSFNLEAFKPLNYEFPPEFQAYWIRFKSSHSTTATAQLSYR